MDADPATALRATAAELGVPNDDRDDVRVTLRAFGRLKSSHDRLRKALTSLTAFRPPALVVRGLSVAYEQGFEASAIEAAKAVKAIARAALQPSWPTDADDI